MRRLGNTVAQLTAARRAMRAAVAKDDGRLGWITGFGSNPGALDARTYVPDDLADNAALVVVLHGCTQNASIYDRGSGWSTLADRHGFALLFPEQRRANNANLCFHWYEPGDARRDRGEALSISQMIKHMTSLYRIDSSRVFVTGLSAGGAMTSVMLTSYPELFAGGAIIAGLPFASANTLPEALERMRGHGAPSRGVLAARAKRAANHGDHKPTLSIWHGTRDTIVHPVNSDAMVDQWRDLHGLGTQPGIVEFVDGHRREVWRDARGRDLVEKYEVEGMAHGTPLATRDAEAIGIAGPHMLEAKICSTRRIAGFWGLTQARPARQDPWRPKVALASIPIPVGSNTIATPPALDVGRVIEGALRAAGLMR